MVLTTDKARVSIYLSHDVKKWLEQSAKKQNRSMSNYIEWLLTELMNKGIVKADD